MGDHRFLLISHPVRGAILVKHLGCLLIVLAVLQSVSLMASLDFGDFAISFPYALVATGFVAAGWVMDRVRAPSDMRTNEALVLTALLFSIASAVAAMPFLAVFPHFIDAPFEAVSGVTTTGLSTLDTPQDLPMTF